MFMKTCGNDHFSEYYFLRDISPFQNQIAKINNQTDNDYIYNVFIYLFIK